ncbi:hypothetical protein SAY86_001354 [Trapa natans]|uniref:Uncharacterized protein n=1 Tax=Trapa natans TaxID=22666 RepID=A0AAN7N0S0_TRANT|nr:hypothetical protein SAY86_001354 [Trapa natans]
MGGMWLFVRDRLRASRPNSWRTYNYPPKVSGRARVRQICACAYLHILAVQLTQREVIEFCKRNLACFKVPKKKVFVAGTLPNTASEKIQRRAVAEHLIARISTARVAQVRRLGILGIDLWCNHGLQIVTQSPPLTVK